MSAVRHVASASSGSTRADDSTRRFCRVAAGLQFARQQSCRVKIESIRTVKAKLNQLVGELPEEGAVVITKNGPHSRLSGSVSFAHSDPEAGKRGASVVGISNATETATDGTVLMDLHRLAEKRSIAYHRLIAERIRRDPSILEGARARVRSWISATGGVPFYAHKWHDILSRHVDAIAAFLIEDTELARELRQSTPFAGALSPAERWEIWRAVGASESMGRDTRRA